MNKYLRSWLLQSPLPPLRRIGSRSLRKTHARRHGEFQRQVLPLLYPDGDPRVLNGPFAGMRYLDETVWGSITPRWIGSYESCLWPIIAEIIERSHRRIIDVGCAEGYYATGLAKALPQSEIFAFDMDEDSQAQALRLWRLNGSPGSLQVRGLLTHQDLRDLTTEGDLLICDIEGAEMQLLAPERCDRLRGIDILVEVHEAGGRSVAENEAELFARLQTTHHITRIDESMRRTEFDGLGGLEPQVLKRAVSEGRPYQQVWLWMKKIVNQ